MTSRGGVVCVRVTGHSLLVEPSVVAGYRRYRRRFAYPFPNRDFLPGGVRPGGFCRNFGRDAAEHAGVGSGAL